MEGWSCRQLGQEALRGRGGEGGRAASAGRWWHAGWGGETGESSGSPRAGMAEVGPPGGRPRARGKGGVARWGEMRCLKV